MAVKECADCGHPMRPSHSKASDHPGTREHRSEGKCHTCYMRKWRNKKRRPRPKACKECGAAVRPQYKTEAEHPGTVKYGAKGFCVRCYGIKKRQGSVRHYRPRTCKDCARDVHSWNEEKPHPESIQYGGYGRCRTCYQRWRATSPTYVAKPVQLEKPAECLDCGIRLRTAKDEDPANPGTRRHAAKGLCTVCYGVRWRQKNKPVDKPVAVPQPEPIADQATAAYLRKRRERLARQQRLTQVRRPAA